MGRPRQISNEEIKQIRSLYKQGNSSYKIKEITGWNHNTVMFYINEPRDRGRYPKLNVQQIQELNRLYDSGLTQRELGEKYSMVQGQISKYIWHPRKKWAWIKEKKTAEAAK